MVRHGETGGNVAHRHQAEDSELSFRGAEQAQAVAERLAPLGLTHLVSSNLVRAIDTAKVIGEVTNLTTEIHPQFAELKRPKHMYGHFHRSPRSLWFYVWWYLGSQSATKAEGESYRSFRTRLDAAREVLESYPPDAKIVVVTHSVFMTLFVAHVCNPKPLRPMSALKSFYQIVTTPNTHTMHLTFEHQVPANTCAWSVEG